MVLVDTSVWIHHLRRNEPKLQNLLFEEQVLIHPMIIGEMACGHLQKRKELLSLLQALPLLKVAHDDEVLTLIDQKQLSGIGLGWIDMHLLASVLISKVKIFTEDKKLKQIASKLHVDF